MSQSASPAPSFLGRLPEQWRGTAGQLWVQLRRPIQGGVVASLLTALYTITLPNQFKSEARILPADSRSGGGIAAAAAAVGVSIPGQESADAAYVDILKSRSLWESLLNSHLTFKVRTWYFGTEQARQQTLYDYLEEKNMDRALSALKPRITVTRDFKTKLITIAVETESQQISQQVAKQMVVLLDDFVIGKARTRGGAKAAFSEKRLKEAREDVDQAEVALRTFLEGNRNYLLSPDPGIKLRGARLESDLKLRIQIVMTLAIAREQAMLEEKNDMPIINVLDPGNLPVERSGPHRGRWVLFVGALVFIVSLLRNRIMDRWIDWANQQNKT